ncbi:MAG: hypothetical protein EBR82_88475 [Caulobacteraceae bacterium]|nr:hypothetical protein [Caulobacteraceae bacterium]
MTTPRLYRWSADTRGTTPRPEAGALAVLRCMRRATAALPRPWSVCRCEATRTGTTLVNVSDHRTMREAVAALATEAAREAARREFATAGLDAAVEIEGFDTMTADQYRDEVTYLSDYQG